MFEAPSRVSTTVRQNLQRPAPGRLDRPHAWPHRPVLSRLTARTWITHMG